MISLCESFEDSEEIRANNVHFRKISATIVNDDRRVVLFCIVCIYARNFSDISPRREMRRGNSIIAPKSH